MRGRADIFEVRIFTLFLSAESICWQHAYLQGERRGEGRGRGKKEQRREEKRVIGAAVSIEGDEQRGEGKGVRGEERGEI